MEPDKALREIQLQMAIERLRDIGILELRRADLRQYLQISDEALNQLGFRDEIVTLQEV